MTEVLATSRPPTARLLYALKRMYSSPGMLLGIAMVTVSFLVAIILPLVGGAGAVRIDFTRTLLPPFTGSHLMGTDQLGRDIFVLASAGLRTSFLISLSAVGVALVIGLFVGLVGGYFGGWVDTVLMRLTDIQMALPFIVLAVVILSVAPPSYLSLTVVLSLAAWPTYARVVRGATRVERTSDHVQAALALGASPVRIIIHYLMRSIAGSIVIVSILDVATIIIYEAALSFLGIGVPPGIPSLGLMMAEGKNYVATAWWITAMPGVVILFTIAGLNLIGVGLRSAAAKAGRR